MARPADVSKQDRWLDLIRRWQRSQSTVRAFCQSHQVSEASFFSWRRVLKERGLLAAVAAETATPTPAFLRLTTLDAEPSSSVIELVLDQGRVLRVRPGFDADLLVQLVRLLEKPAC